jgi:hypothetical protein
VITDAEPNRKKGLAWEQHEEDDERVGITIVLGSILCDPYTVAMWTGARLPSAEFTILSWSSPTGRTSDGEHLLWNEFFCHTNLHVQKGRQRTRSGDPVWTVYALLTTDIGRLCRKALMSALFICKPPL